MLQCRGIRKSYGAVHALRDASLELAAGTITALRGENGSGKSTLIRICATLQRPDAGSLSIGGVDAAREPLRARRALGFVGHESMLDVSLTMRENLVLFARLYGVPEPGMRAAELIERLGAQHFADNPVASMSRGQEQAAALARSLVHAPQLLLLDEPSTGLDAAAQNTLRTILSAEAAKGTCVLFSTHDESMLPLATHRLLMVEGRVQAAQAD